MIFKIILLILLFIIISFLIALPIALLLLWLMEDKDIKEFEIKKGIETSYEKSNDTTR